MHSEWSKQNYPFLGHFENVPYTGKNPCRESEIVYMWTKEF
jgi:hypothetical protein